MGKMPRLAPPPWASMELYYTDLIAELAPGKKRPSKKGVKKYEKSFFFFYVLSIRLMLNWSALLRCEMSSFIVHRRVFIFTESNRAKQWNQYVKYIFIANGASN
jgi:hypothetical protein